MPITKSAKKALRSAKRKKVVNSRRTSELKNTIKEYKKLIADKKGGEAAKLTPKLQQVIDKAAKQGVIKKNTAARKKSRLMKKLAK